MAQKDWGTDDFLDEFLDFDYKKPVPDHPDKQQGLHAERKTEQKKDNKGYGLSDDPYKEYERLRHGSNTEKKAEQSADGGQRVLHSSGGYGLNIPEPLSAKRGNIPAFAQPGKTESRKAAEASVKKEPVKSDNVSDTDKAAGSKHRHFRASEMAAGAFEAAKKLITTDEDYAPEEIPSAAPEIAEYKEPQVKRSHKFIETAEINPSGSSAGAASVTGKAEGRDELADLFAEFGEPVQNESAHADGITPDEDAALRQAQEEAYDRYRGKYSGKKKKKKINLGGSGNGSGSGSKPKGGVFTKWLSRIYILALLVFAGIMTIMNVLPFGMLIALYIVLGLLSIIIVVQLRKRSVKKLVKGLASITAILLIAFFGVGTAYAMGTLSFLDSTSVKNDKKVGSVTREPFNVCLTGIDVWGTIDEQGRSDVNMIVTVNPKTEQILMTSIPRDYQIYMPDMDFAMDKLTHTGFYSVDTTMAAEENLLDTKLNYYVKINFSTVEEFIDAIGGIDVYSDYEFVPVKLDDWTVQEGWNHMNGEQALAFARERKAFVDGDNQRIKNQQAVFEALIKKATGDKTMLLSYNKVLTEMRDYFRMSFSSGEIRRLIKHQLSHNPQWKIYKNTIIGGNDLMPTYTTGNARAYVMTQDEDSIENAKSLINAVLEGKTLSEDEDGNVIVEGAEETEENGESVETEGQ